MSGERAGVAQPTMMLAFDVEHSDAECERWWFEARVRAPAWDEHDDPECWRLTALQELRRALWRLPGEFMCWLVGHDVRGYVFVLAGRRPEMAHTRCRRCSLEWFAPVQYVAGASTGPGPAREGLQKWTRSP